jgi:mannosyltransferase OCH1-like enzyme
MQNYRKLLMEKSVTSFGIQTMVKDIEAIGENISSPTMNKNYFSTWTDIDSIFFKVNTIKKGFYFLEFEYAWSSSNPKEEFRMGLLNSLDGDYSEGIMFRKSKSWEKFVLHKHLIFLNNKNIEFYLIPIIQKNMGFINLRTIYLTNLVNVNSFSSSKIRLTNDALYDRIFQDSFIRKYFLLSEKSNKRRVKEVSFLPEISKIIHQTYYSKEDLPVEIKENIKRLKSLNPTWEYRLYDDTDIENYIKSNFPSILKLYKKINPIYGAVRADLFRYLVIYNEGGVYLDIKSTFLYPLDSKIKDNDQAILSHWNNKDWGRHPEIANLKGEFQQCFIIMTKGHPFMKVVIEYVLQNIKNYRPYFHGSGKENVLRISGPIVFTLAIESILDDYPYRLLNSVEDLGYIYSIYDNNEKHKTLFSNHYATLLEPIIKTNKIINKLEQIAIKILLSLKKI